MKLFDDPFDRSANLLPMDGEVYYFGKIFTPMEADRYFKEMMKHIAWQNDEAVIFGKLIKTKRKVAWYGDRPFDYTYSNLTKKLCLGLDFYRI